MVDIVHLHPIQEMMTGFRLAAALVAPLLVQSPQLSATELEAQVYIAGMHESRWVFSGSGLSCELRHDVPRFGQARFRHLVGETLHFIIDSYQPVPEKVEATLREVSPPWEHTAPDLLEQQVTIGSGVRPVRLGRKPAGWLLTSLAKGQVGSFDFADWNDSRRQVHVRLSPVNFQKPYRQFKQCLSRLSSKGSAALRDSTVHFALDAHALDDRAKKQLKQLAAYILADEGITRITIVGHTDDQGSGPYNERLSAMRAETVYGYLEEQGVKPGLMIQRHYGESRPMIAKRTEKARTANRRVRIRLQRSSTHRNHPKNRS